VHRVAILCALVSRVCAVVLAAPTVLAPGDTRFTAVDLGFSAERALGHASHLAEVIGPRPAGSDSERRAAYDIADTFRAAGYSPVVQPFPLPNGRRSQNVIAVKPGARGKHRDDVLVIGAHYDGKGPTCPGADDNGSGIGVLLELARILKPVCLFFTIKFVAFGAEEMIDVNKDHHHYGSRHYVQEYRRARSHSSPIVGMICIDMVGVGPRMYARSLGVGDQFLVQAVLRQAKRAGVAASSLRDPGWSDHEPFEKAGIPSVWIERRPSPGYHTSHDTADRLKTPYLTQTGLLVLNTILGLDQPALRQRALRGQTWRGKQP